jgi:hypothetical protein
VLHANLRNVVLFPSVARACALRGCTAAHFKRFRRSTIVAMLTNDAFRAMLSNQPTHADATPAEPEEPEQPQRTAVDLWAEAPTQPPVPFDGSHGLGLLSQCGCFDIAAEHVDPSCDLVAQNPHADLWAESDEQRERSAAQALGIMRQSKTDSRRLRGDLVPLSLVKRVLDSKGWRNGGVPERAECERAVALAKSARIAPNTWQLGRAQARCVPIHIRLQTLVHGAAASTSRRSCPSESACTPSLRPVGHCPVGYCRPTP